MPGGNQKSAGRRERAPRRHRFSNHYTPRRCRPGFRRTGKARGRFPAVGPRLGEILAGATWLLTRAIRFSPRNTDPFPPLFLAAIITVALIILTRALPWTGLWTVAAPCWGL